MSRVLVDIRLPDLSLEQASALLDVLDALTAAVVREYGDEIARSQRESDRLRVRDDDLPF